MKFKKSIVTLSVLLLSTPLSTTATADIFTDAGDALVELYDDFIDKWNQHSPELDWPIGYVWGLDANNSYVETTSYTEPSVDSYTLLTLNNLISDWPKESEDMKKTIISKIGTLQ